MSNDTLRPRTAHDWSNWFWNTAFPDWVTRVQDPQGGVFDALDANGNPDPASGKTILAQARTLFTFAHAALASGHPDLIAAARRQVEAIKHFEKAPGLYRCKINRDGTATNLPEDEVARSYDQTFVILGLITWHKISPSDATLSAVEACWNALTSTLTDPKTGLLKNDDSTADTGPAQNPHMHLYEACLQAYRMTSDAIWLTRATELRTIGLRYFMDQDSGSIAEFLTPDLQPLPGADGRRREVGHQCEWAWLLLEEAELSGNQSAMAPAERLIDFATNHGFQHDGALEGAVFDAVSSSGETVENTFLLWPQTEAIKILATRHRTGDPAAGDKAVKLMCRMFERWFADRPVFVNQLDAQGDTIWPEALTRLMYHVVLAMSEGAKAGLWPDTPRHED